MTRALLCLTLLVTVSGLAAAGTERARGWRSIGLSGGGAMYTPAISPLDSDLLLLNCDMSGAYRSTDGGKSWQMLHYRQLRGATRVRPAFHPTDPKVVFAADGWEARLKVSRDKGVTWSPAPGLTGAVTAIAIDPGQPKVMLVGTEGGASRSLDGGKTWARTSGLQDEVLGFHFDQTSPAAHRVCFAATRRGVLRSDNGGGEWHAVGQGLPKASLVAFAGGSNRAARSCVLYASLESRNAENGIYRSADRGVTWSKLPEEGMAGAEPNPWGGPRRPPSYAFLAVSDANPSVVYAATAWGGRLYRSDDRGERWRPRFHFDRSAPDFNFGPNYLLDETDGGGDNISGLTVSPSDPEHVVVTDWMSCYLTRDGGKSWTSGHTRSAEEHGRRGKGMRWANTGLVVTTVWHYYVDPFAPNRHYLAYTDIGFARSTDAGATWNWVTGGPLRNTTYELAFDPEVPGMIWGAFADLHDIPNDNVISGRHYSSRAGGGVGLTTNHGAAWRDTSAGLPKRPITSIVLDPKSPKQARTLYASAFEDGVYRSTDGGASWVRKSQGLGAPENTRVCRLILHPDGTLFCLVTAMRRDEQFVAQGAGLYRSRDGAETWELITRSQPLRWPKDFDVDPRDSRVVYLGAADADDASGGLYKTVDGGGSWKRIARRGPQTFGATVSPHHPDWVYMCLTEGAPDCGLWLSKDGGETWTALDDLPFGNIQRVAFDPKDPSVIYVATFGGSVWRGPAE